MVTKRKAGGGRKPMVMPNPFVVYDHWGEEENILWENEDELETRVEEILIGCIRSFNAHKPWSVRQEYVSWSRLFKVYRNCNTLTRQKIQNQLQCSESQAKRYVRVIKLANPFLERLVKGDNRSNIKGYIDMTPDQVEAGYLENL